MNKAIRNFFTDRELEIIGDAVEEFSCEDEDYVDKNFVNECDIIINKIDSILLEN